MMPAAALAIAAADKAQALAQYHAATELEGLYTWAQATVAVHDALAAAVALGRAMERWRAAYVAAHGREPILTDLHPAGVIL